MPAHGCSPGCSIWVPGEAGWLAGAVLTGGVAGSALRMFGLTGMPASGAALLLNAEGVLTAVIAWVVSKVDLCLYAFVGVIMLIGIVKKNAIMMIDFALEQQRKDAMAAGEAIFQAYLIRFTKEEHFDGETAEAK